MWSLMGLKIWCNAFLYFIPCSYLGGLILFYWADVYDDSTVQCLWSSCCCLSLHGPVWWVLHLHYGSYCLRARWGSGCLPGHWISAWPHVSAYDSWSTHRRWVRAGFVAVNVFLCFHDFLAVFPIPASCAELCHLRFSLCVLEKIQEIYLVLMRYYYTLQSLLSLFHCFAGVKCSSKET